MNILILSCGTRNKIVQYFKRELAGRGSVIATDCSQLAPALYEADKYYIVPRLESEDYLNVLLSICNENKIKGVISLIDPELSFLAQNRGAFIDIGAVPIVSNLQLVEMCFDKYQMYNFLINTNLLTLRSYEDKDRFYQDVAYGHIGYPVFIKPVRGSSSINTNKVESREEVELLFQRYENLMIQEYATGAEYGADVYIDIISREVVSIFVKEKLKMRAGETDKSVSVKDERLFRLIIDFVRKTGLMGVIDIDLFKINEEYYISEVNPRFGGGYPHAYECGVNIPKMILNNLSNITNPPDIGSYKENYYMMKYNEVTIFTT